jgi:hypothetical protein
MKSVHVSKHNWEVVTYLNDKFTPASIRRLNDDQTFAINDYITNGTQMRGHITKFELSSDLNEVFVYTDWSGIGMDLDHVYHIDSRKLPSKFQHGDSVIVQFDSNQRLHGKVTKVSFTVAKVLYDVEVAITVPGAEFESKISHLVLGTDSSDDRPSKQVFYTRIHSIDAAFVRSSTDTVENG